MALPKPGQSTNEPIFQEASFSDILQPGHLSLTRAQVEYTIPHCQPQGALVTFLQHTCVGEGGASPHTLGIMCHNCLCQMGNISQCYTNNINITSSRLYNNIA